jgi:hypothetical protein
LNFFSAHRISVKNKTIKMNDASFLTLTFGDMAENHVGMEQLGKLVNKGEGFNLEDLINIKTKMEELGCVCELNSLDMFMHMNEWCEDALNADIEPAHVLVIKDGVDKLLKNCSEYSANDMFKEQIALDVDRQAFMYGRVVEKHARWNLCFDNESRAPDYENGKGRIIGYDEVPITKKLHEQFETYFGEKAHNLKGEGNYYYDIRKCGIGFHGDSERRKVIGVRLGENSMPLHYQWFKDGKAIGERIILNVNGGDIYIMSEKAVGTDWKRKKIFTLRHATGSNKFTNI